MGIGASLLLHWEGSARVQCARRMRARQARATELVIGGGPGSAEVKRNRMGLTRRRLLVGLHGAPHEERPARA
jgi:hypothetical protein